MGAKWGHTWHFHPQVAAILTAPRLAVYWYHEETQRVKWNEAEAAKARERLLSQGLKPLGFTG